MMTAGIYTAMEVYVPFVMCICVSVCIKSCMYESDTILLILFHAHLALVLMTVLAAALAAVLAAVLVVVLASSSVILLCWAVT